VRYFNYNSSEKPCIVIYIMRDSFHCVNNLIFVGGFGRVKRFIRVPLKIDIALLTPMNQFNLKVTTVFQKPTNQRSNIIIYVHNCSKKIDLFWRPANHVENRGKN